MDNTNLVVPRLSPPAPPAWSATSSTKFRTPRLRSDLVERQQLLNRAAAFALERRLTLVCAPAGFGKSTLLAQLAHHLSRRARCVWLSLDGDDNYPNRLIASLLVALQAVGLEWEVPPQTLAAQVHDAGRQSRAALSLLVNALCSYEGERLLIVLDDLHRVTDTAALQLLDALVERLPPEVGLVVGTRTEPALSLPRLRAAGDLGELLGADLQFNADETRTFAAVRLAGAATPELVDEVLARTGGWAAGLQLVVGAAIGTAAAGVPVLARRAAHRHLFDFFAHEVLRDLPHELRDFILQCSVLSELNPTACNAVTQRQDSRQLLDVLYRHNLFLTALDDSVPVLRFHDLFLDFLRAELELHMPGLAPELHARAAQAEPVAPRAVTHWLEAGQWDEALALILQCAEPLLAEGAQAMVERWLAQLPEKVQAQPEGRHLKGLCAWARWDWACAARSLEEAATAYRERGDAAAYLRAVRLLPQSYNSAGKLDAAARVLAALAEEPLDASHRAIFDAASAWHATGRGEPDKVAPALQSLVEQIEREPDALSPATNDLFTAFMTGLPGAMTPLRRLRELAQQRLQRANAPWQVEALACMPWPELWHGEVAAAVVAVQKQTALGQRLAIVGPLQLSRWQTQALLAAFLGRHAEAEAHQRATLDAMEAFKLPRFSQSWYRPTAGVLARIHWMAQDAEALRRLWPLFEPPRNDCEWPVIDMIRAQVKGHLALIDGRLADASQALEQAVALNSRFPLPSFVGDPRPALARLRLQQGRRSEAWSVFEPVLQEALAEDSLGPLLFEPPEALQRLLALAPESLAVNSTFEALQHRLDDWRAQAEAPSTVCSDRPSLLQALSQRELEVLERLAAGDSNKLIARALDLSPHTVKRHVANILDKLGCSTRGAAAAHWRSQA